MLATAVRLARSPIASQFLRFAVVGGSATVLDAGLHYTLMFMVRSGGRPLPDVFGEEAIARFQGLHVSPHSISFFVFKVLTSGLAILYSFALNRLWTFQAKGRGRLHRQFVVYTLVALGGLTVNSLVASSLNAALPGPSRLSWAFATAVATFVAAFWNFWAHRRWSFAT